MWSWRPSPFMVKCVCVSVLRGIPHFVLILGQWVPKTLALLPVLEQVKHEEMMSSCPWMTPTHQKPPLSRLGDVAMLVLVKHSSFNEQTHVSTFAQLVSQWERSSHCLLYSIKTGVNNYAIIFFKILYTLLSLWNLCLKPASDFDLHFFFSLTCVSNGEKMHEQTSVFRIDLFSTNIDLPAYSSTPTHL